MSAENLHGPFWKAAALGALALLLPTLAFGAEPDNNTIAWGTLAMGLMGGLALFLLGMEMMSDALRRAAGDRMRAILGMLTHDRVIGLLVGTGVTMVIQSSSATTVMLVSFVEAQLMSFPRTLGVILGADIGTTITAQLIAFKLTAYSLLMAAGGFLLRILARKDNLKETGEAILGFGLLFFGMHLMSEAMSPLRHYQPFLAALVQLENPLIGILVGTLFTALIQSSSASTGIIIVLASQGDLTLEGAIPLILGANIGTCVTAILAAMNTSRAAKRVAAAHVLFKIAGVLLFVFWIPYFADLIRWVSMGADMPRMVANAHTIFNVAFSLAFLPFLGVFARLVERLVPDLPEEAQRRFQLRHIDPNQLAFPATAIPLVRREIRDMGETIQEMLRLGVEPFISPDAKPDPEAPQVPLEEAVTLREQKVDFLYEETEKFLLALSRKELSNSQASEVNALLTIVSDLERVADVVFKETLPLLQKKQRLAADFTPEGKAEIQTFYTKTAKQLARMNDMFSMPRVQTARHILAKDSKYEQIIADLRSSHLARCRDQQAASLATHEIHMELLDQLKHIGVLVANIARSVLRAHGDRYQPETQG